MKPQDHSILAEDFECVDPEVGEQYLHGYVAEALSETQRQDFEDHLVFCHKCQEDLDYLHWATQQLKSHWTPIGEGALTPLPLTSLLDGNLQDLSHDYHEAPLMDQLAASQKATGTVSFPFTVEFAEGRVIGQFLKRAGYLFFRVKKSPADCILVYTSFSKTKTFAFRAGEEKCLGSFEEFVTTNTIQGMVAAMKRFQLFMKQ